MNSKQLTLTRLLGKKKSTFGGLANLEYNEIATLSDLHRWMNEKSIQWAQDRDTLIMNGDFDYPHTPVEYDSYKDLLDQNYETIARIIEFINNQS